ncbi:MAG: 3-phosphoshikimate 1-carboxyvinyltransferase [Nocardioides sp.]
MSESERSERGGELAAWPAPRVAPGLDAVISLPGSKSLTNRALVLAALADGPSTVRRALRSRDTLLMADALRRLGAAVDATSDDWTVRPGSDDRAPGDRASVDRAAADEDSVLVDCGLAGTVMRFVPPVAALGDRRVRFDGDVHMRLRPVGPLLDALGALGVRIRPATAGALPFVIEGHGAVPGGTVIVNASASSQFLSALLLSGARFTEGLDVRHQGPAVPSLPHLTMTIDMLGQHGVAVDDSEADRWVIRPTPIEAADVLIEPDLSNAAPFAALALVSGGSVTVRDWPRRTTQAGDALREILTAMGAAVDWTDNGLRITGGAAIEGVELDLRDVGELTPAVAALCALASGPSTLRGVEHIRGHETDRISALAQELTNLGADVTELPDGLKIRPARLTGGLWRTYADHRMAHAGVIIGAAVDQVVVENIATTSKTFPDFATTWSATVSGHTGSPVP